MNAYDSELEPGVLEPEVQQLTEGGGRGRVDASPSRARAR
jgi:hypothetical protein